MSLSSMSQLAFSRRTDTAIEVPAPRASGVNRAVRGDSASGGAVSDAIGAIAAYFPSELNVLYTAAVAILANSGDSSAVKWAVFGVMCAFAPVVVWLLYASKVKEASKPLPYKFGSWPLAEMVIAAVAFTAWAAALPGSPFDTIGFGPSIAGVSLLAVSLLLGLIAPLFARPITIASAE